MLAASALIIAPTALTLLSTALRAEPQAGIQYTYDAAGNLTGAMRTASGNKPDLTVSDLSVGVITAVGNGSFSFPVTFQVHNVGGAPAAASWYDRGYLSASPTLHDPDQVLSGSVLHGTTLAAGSGYVVNAIFTTSTTTAIGNWYLVVKADGGASASGQYSATGPNYVDEDNEFNNTQALRINLPATPKPDLTVSSGSIGAITVNQNGSYSFPISFQVKNVGSSSATPTWYDVAYLASNGVLDNSSVNISGYHPQSTVLASGSSYTATTTFSTGTSAVPGTYTLFIKADGRGPAIGLGTNTDNGYVAEADEGNNAQALPITLPVKPDLAVSNASVGAVTVRQDGAYTFSVSFTVTNIGGATAQPTWYDVTYLSTDGVLDNSDGTPGYSARNSPLAAGSSYTTTFTATTATNKTPGNYTLFVKADGRGAIIGLGTNTDNGYLTEANETNNTQAVPITLPQRPDLTVSNVSAETIIKNANGSYSIPVSFKVNNIGGSSAAGSWYDLAYLSTNTTLEKSDPNLAGYHIRSTPLSAGGNYAVSMTFTTSTTIAAGTYTLFIKADGRGPAIGVGTNTDNGYVSEADETNNVAAVTVLLP